MKSLYIAEKPSVAQEFAKVLGVKGQRHEGYVESEDCVVTWCVGHLVTMSYPEKYDAALKKWSMETLPFLPKEFLYEVIPGVKKQYDVVKDLLNRKDVETIYVCTDSGREGEYIYRLVARMAGVTDKDQRRVWIDSQTEEEILRGIREAKSISAYDNLAASAYLRAKEDYLMGINFSRVLSLRYAYSLCDFLKMKYQAISVGRVMTCVLGMVVRRERDIRAFVKTPFYRVIAGLMLGGELVEAEWKAVEGSRYFNSPLLYKENGFKKRKDAERLIEEITAAADKTEAGDAGSDLSDAKTAGLKSAVIKIERKKENKNPPLLFNLAELQNVCSRLFKISPDQTLAIAQDLYEKKLVTYPRTDARVLSSAVAKEISRNISGLKSYEICAEAASEALELGAWKTISKTRYTNDKQITDHYAIIPTGQGFKALNGLSQTAQQVYEVIVRRFLSIFYPPAVYQKFALTVGIGGEQFFASFKVLLSEGYQKIATASFAKKKTEDSPKNAKGNAGLEEEEEISCDEALIKALTALRKGSVIPVKDLSIKEGETSPPKRYNSGSIILAMENAGQLIEDEELRAQIKGSGIGTSATRAEILKKLFSISYLALNKKTQVITPTQMGEMVYDVVDCSIRQLLNPELTASWEKGLTYVAEGTISEQEYMDKLEQFVAVRTNQVKETSQKLQLLKKFQETAAFYK
ncbi:MAG: type IA DNA topoisomerase [Blautia sp.]|nr:type IA DNA topoisomerase [Blautia sp.]